MLGYSLFNLQERGKLMCAHGDEVYEGQVIGIHSRENDLVADRSQRLADELDRDAFELAACARGEHVGIDGEQRCV